MKTKQILPPTYLVIALILMVILHFAFPLIKIIPLPWSVLGLIPIIFGGILNFLADASLHKAGTTVKPFEESTALNTDSVYGISRHPMYLGFVLILAGVSILLGSLSPWVIIPVFAILMEVVFIRVEESMLDEKFGSAWLEYKKNV